MLIRSIPQTHPLKLSMKSASLAAHFLAVGVMSFVYGCAHILPHQQLTHTLDYLQPPKITQSQIQDTLMVYRFRLAPSVDAYALVVRRSNGTERQLGKHRWSENPADMITDLIQRDITGAGPFSRTIGQYSDDQYRYALEGKVLELRGVEENKKIFAVLEVKVTLTDFEAPFGGKKLLLDKSYKVRMPCTDDKPRTIVQALGKGTQEFSALLLRDINKTMNQPTSGGTRKVQIWPAIARAAVQFTA